MAAFLQNNQAVYEYLIQQDKQPLSCKNVLLACSRIIKTEIIVRNGSLIVFFNPKNPSEEMLVKATQGYPQDVIDATVEEIVAVGDQLVKDGGYNLAYDYFKTALILGNPDQAHINLYKMASCSKKLNNPTEAAGSFRLCTALAPDSEISHLAEQELAKLEGSTATLS
jgi:hypothetical protein